MIQVAAWRDAEENQTRSAAYLKHPAGPQPLNPLGRTLDPFAHLSFGNRIARIATLPARGFRGAAMLVSLVPDHLPVRGRRRLGQGAALGGGNDVGYEALCAGRIRTGHDRALSYRGMSIQCSLDLARLNPVTADLHLMVEASQVRKRAVGQPLAKIAGPVDAR